VEYRQVSSLRNEQNKVVVDQYEIDKLLGTGSYAKVKLARGLKDGKLYAVKIFSRSKLKKQRITIKNDKGEIKYRSAIENVHREIGLMKSLSHPNLLQYVDSFEDDFEDVLYMVLEYASGGQAIDWDEERGEFFVVAEGKDRMEEQEIRAIFRGVIAAVEYCRALV
jgi:[calcium/calmodulin-dependent protein kinase] kinase